MVHGRNIRFRGRQFCINTLAQDLLNHLSIEQKFLVTCYTLSNPKKNSLDYFIFNTHYFVLRRKVTSNIILTQYLIEVRVTQVYSLIDIVT